MNLNYTTLFLIAISIAVLSCGKKDWSKKIEMPLSCSTNFSEDASLGNNRLEVSEAKFYISSITIHGERLQGEDVEVFRSETMELDLLENSIINAIDIPIGTYEKLSIVFGLSSNSYLNGDVVKINGNPEVKQISLPLDLQNKTLEFDLIEEEEQEVLSISEEGKQLKLRFDLQKTLDAVGVGSWNGLITASQSQTNIDVTTIAGGNFLLNFKEQLLENSSLNVE